MTSQFKKLKIPGVSDKLLLCFFRAFSRFEYALKEKGFARKDRYGQATPHWNDFEKIIGSRLVEKKETDPSLREAMDDLLSEPPEIQIFVGAAIPPKWGKRAFRNGSTNNGEKVLEAVRRVRNNLFHGGKDGKPYSQAGRDKRLLRHSLTVLEACLDLCPDLKCTFWEPIP